jgi:hypothetical protein
LLNEDNESKILAGIWRRNTDCHTWTSVGEPVLWTTECQYRFGRDIVGSNNTGTVATVVWNDQSAKWNHPEWHSSSTTDYGERPRWFGGTKFTLQCHADGYEFGNGPSNPVTTAANQPGQPNQSGTTNTIHSRDFESI